MGDLAAFHGAVTKYVITARDVAHVRVHLL